MAKLFSNENGQIIGYYRLRDDFPEPDEYYDVLEFDEETNKYIDDGLSLKIDGVSWQDISIQNSILYFKENPVTINPPGDTWNANNNFEDAKTRLLSSNIADMTPEQIFTAMQNQMDSWTSLADARASLREWLPMMAATIIWMIRRDN